eukprot:CAMPEP_0182466780 /NCGR_PEP_ID=MMETSP1319-20130603/12612_1 /TAXON_ID=172717 /ORGANISM="Bolidomonas pacifica, Strain RCC208" /LENGTH=304 /DNA_ID=CAMNT_0024666813 /DNA_START=96 /DNA_END=1006 /DNA_ORIENTATION=-
MGNLLSSGPSAASQHTPPPPLIPLCISGNLDSYLETYEELAKQEGPNPLTVVDAQRNNVLHALFSSNQPNPSILEHIVKESSPKFEALMSFKNALGCTPVWIAVAYGNHSALPDDVTAEALVECNDRGDSPLLAACSKANLEALQYLSDKLGRLGFEKECMRPNKSGSTPLFVSLSASSAPVLEFLLPHFPAASFSAKNAVGLTPLHVAAERGFLAGVAACLSNSRSSVDAVDKNGATALHIAAFVGDVPCVEALLDAGAKDAKDERGKGPLFVAKIRGHGGCAEAMVKRGFKLSEVEEEELEA